MEQSRPSRPGAIAQNQTTATSPKPPNPPPAVHTITIHVPHGTAMHR
jgi:hypothetical protein